MNYRIILTVLIKLVFIISFYGFADKSYKHGIPFGPMNSSNNTGAIPQARALQIMKTEKHTNWMFINA